MRGAHFNYDHQSKAGKKRASTKAFRSHNQVIAPDGPAAQSAYMRAMKGSALLDPWHIEFLFLKDMRKGIELGETISEKDQRLLFGWYVWNAIWGNLNAPSKPTADEFLSQKDRVKDIVGRGEGLCDPLDVLFIAPDDFCDRQGVPLRRRKQRKAFRMALGTARTAAEAQSIQRARQQEEHQPRKAGQRLPMVAATQPTFVTRSQVPKKYRHRHRLV